MRIFSILLLVATGATSTLSSVWAAPWQAARDAAPGVPGTESWTFTSEFQTGDNKVEVLRPDPLVPGRRYPVVYVLPVNAGTQGAWGHPLEEARRFDLANRHQVILVTPSFAVLPWFGDNPLDPALRQNRHVSEAVVPFVDANYPTLATARGRALVGFSKSALGALQLYVLEPGKFGAAAVFENWWGVPDDKQWREWGFATCYGTRETYDALNPATLLARERTTLVTAGRPLAVLIGGPDSRLGTEALLMTLRQHRIPHTELRDMAWGHTWKSPWLPLALAALLPGPDGFGPPAER